MALWEIGGNSDGVCGGDMGVEGTEGSGGNAGEMDQMDTGDELVYLRVYNKGRAQER